MKGQLEGLTGERLREFKATRLATLALVAPLSDAQLAFSAEVGSWSISEVADHLELSEKMWRGEMTRLIALVRAGQPARVKRSFAEVNVAPLQLPDAVLAAMEVPLGFVSRFVPESVMSVLTQYPILPARNPDIATPGRGKTRAELMEGLQAEFERTRLVLEDNADLDFEAMTSEHPITGRTNIPQMLNFLIRHERRHQEQIERVRTDSRFPRA